MVVDSTEFPFQEYPRFAPWQLDVFSQFLVRSSPVWGTTTPHKFFVKTLRGLFGGTQFQGLAPTVQSFSRPLIQAACGGHTLDQATETFAWARCGDRQVDTREFSLPPTQSRYTISACWFVRLHSSILNTFQKNPQFTWPGSTS